jgi:spore photoproduct lyase
MIEGNQWRPSEIVINEAVREDPVTKHILEMCPRIPFHYVNASTTQDVKAGSGILREIKGDQGIAKHIATGKTVLYVSPAGNAVVKDFEFLEKRMICTEFYKLILTSNGCYFGCDWCFLKMTFRSNQNYITIRTEYDKIKEQILDKLATSSQPITFNTGEVGDSLALDHLTMVGRTFIPWFGTTKNGYLFMLTKSTNVQDILELQHNGHTILAWSVNADEVSAKFELDAPSSTDRLKAAQAAQASGYPIRLRLDPIVPIDENWKEYYAAFIKRIFENVTPERMTLGTLRFEAALYKRRKEFMSQDLITLLEDLKIGPMLSKAKLINGKTSEGKYSFSEERRIEIFKFAVDEIRKYSNCPLSLCKETHAVWAGAGLDPSDCKCVCEYGSYDMSLDTAEVENEQE